MQIAVVLLLCVGSSFALPVKREAGDQTPKIWDALAQLRGKDKLSMDDMTQLYLNAKAGEDYPNLSEIPASDFDCGAHKPGFYADVPSKCQVIRRCDINGNQSSYLCPNMTIFNQITLVCDWFYNVDCSQVEKFYDYSNSRLYQGADVPLLDNQEEVADQLGAVASSKPAASKPAAGKPAAKPAGKATSAPAKATKPAPTTAAPAAEETTAAAEETTAAAAGEETTAAAAGEETTAAAAGEETTAAAGEETTAAAAAGEETTAAAAE